MAITLKLLITVAGTCFALGISGSGVAQANTLISNTESSVKLSTQNSTCSPTSKVIAVGEFRLCDVYVKENGKWVFKDRCDARSGHRCSYVAVTGTLKVINCKTYVPRIRTGNIPFLPQYIQRGVVLNK